SVDSAYIYDTQKQNITSIRYKFGEVPFHPDFKLLPIAISTDQNATIFRPFINSKFQLGLGRSILNFKGPPSSIIEEDIERRYWMCSNPERTYVKFRDDNCLESQASTEPLRCFVLKARFILFGKEHVFQFDLEAFYHLGEEYPLIATSYEDWLKCEFLSGKQ